MRAHADDRTGAILLETKTKTSYKYSVLRNLLMQAFTRERLENFKNSNTYSYTSQPELARRSRINAPQTGSNGDNREIIGNECNTPFSLQAVQGRLHFRLLLLLLLQLALQYLLPRQHPPLVLSPDGVAARVYRQKPRALPLRVHHFFCAMSKLFCDL